MERVVLLLTCSMGIGGLLIASLLVGEQQEDSRADNVFPHSCQLTVAFLPVTSPYTSTEVHLWPAGWLMSTSVQRTAARMQQWGSEPELSTLIPPWAAPVQFVNKTKALRLMIGKEDGSSSYHQWPQPNEPHRARSYKASGLNSTEDWFCTC